MPEHITEESICVSFKDNRLLPDLYGDQDKHLSKLEESLNVSISSRGNMVSISGTAQDVYISESILKNAYKKLENGMTVNSAEFDALIRMLTSSSEDVVVPPMGRPEDTSAAPAPKEDAPTKETSEISTEETPETPPSPQPLVQEEPPVAKQPPVIHEVSSNEKIALSDAQKKTLDDVKQDIKAVPETAAAAMEEQKSPESVAGGHGQILKPQDFEIKTQKGSVRPYTNQQVGYMKSLMSKEVVFAAGPAGTGKTYLAVAAAVNKFINGDVERIVLTRPAVEAGEKLGYLPGDLKEKVDPYLRPLYDALYDMMPAEKVNVCIENGAIEIAPLAYMRGRTLRSAYIILDEAQNTTPSQMKMFLTRLGEGSHMAVTGDLSQTDLPRGMKSGFRDAIEILQGIDEIDFVEFGEQDIVRHKLTMKIVHAYEEQGNSWE